MKRREYIARREMETCQGRRTRRTATQTHGELRTGSAETAGSETIQGNPRPSKVIKFNQNRRGTTIIAL